MEHANIFFDNWGKLGRSVLLAALAYLALIFLLRVSGKRTLSKLNVFDFVFVVALGSTLATTILSSDTTLADGVMAFAVLTGLQVLLSWLCVASRRIGEIVNGEPTLIMHQGRFLEDAMRRERVTREEALAAIRNASVKSFDKVNSIVLETDGTLSVVWRRQEGESSSLVDVPGHPDFVQDDQRADQH
jgi:uncharacterized membrane protein YcaP (DUF421 family)